MQSFIGVLARQEIKIIYKTWKDVPVEAKEFIWDSLNLSYKVIPTWKAGCLESANAKWRQYKSRLYTEYILPNKDNPSMLNDPPPFSGILLEDWSCFVITRLYDDFKKLSEKQREIRKHNIFPHCLSRAGYVGLAEKMSIEAGDAAVPYHDDGDGAIAPPTAKHFDLASNNGFRLKKAMDEAQKRMERRRLAQLHMYRVKAKDKEASSTRSMTNALYAGCGPCQRRNDFDDVVGPEDWCFSRLVADPQPLHGVFELGQSSYTKYKVDAAPLNTFLNLDFSSSNKYQG